MALYIKGKRQREKKRERERKDEPKRTLGLESCSWLLMKAPQIQRPWETQEYPARLLELRPGTKR